jgi:hypothetical protein
MLLLSTEFMLFSLYVFPNLSHEFGNYKLGSNDMEIVLSQVT